MYEYDLIFNFYALQDLMMSLQDIDTQWVTATVKTELMSQSTVCLSSNWQKKQTSDAYRQGLIKLVDTMTYASNHHYSQKR